ncbi:MAG: class I SAM-dependent methyltransferase [Bacteroidota bacterium]
MNKNHLSKAFRHFGLSYPLDRLRFHYLRVKNRQDNLAFLKEHPDVILPPDYLMYESFQLDYQKYYNDSKKTAAWLWGLLSKHGLEAPANILDWGCGPGRIIRHLPGVMPNGINYYGTDYNTESVNWCSKMLPGIHFYRNHLEPPLHKDLQGFDAIYGISIFTHLSEEMHLAWAAELQRVLRPGGLLLLTTQGKAFRVKLLAPEKKRFDNGELVIRGKVKEGHRTFSAFHPPEYFWKLFHELKIMEHIEKEEDSTNPQQDVWIFKKIKS